MPDIGKGLDPHQGHRVFPTSPKHDFRQGIPGGGGVFLPQTMKTNWNHQQTMKRTILSQIRVAGLGAAWLLVAGATTYSQTNSSATARQAGGDGLTLGLVHQRQVVARSWKRACVERRLHQTPK